MARREASTWETYGPDVEQPRTRTAIQAGIRGRPLTASGAVRLDADHRH